MITKACPRKEFRVAVLEICSIVLANKDQNHYHLFLLVLKMSGSTPAEMKQSQKQEQSYLRLIACNSSTSVEVADTRADKELHRFRYNISNSGRSTDRLLYHRISIMSIEGETEGL